MANGGGTLKLHVPCVGRDLVSRFDLVVVRDLGKILTYRAVFVGEYCADRLPDQNEFQPK